MNMNMQIILLSRCLLILNLHVQQQSTPSNCLSLGILKMVFLPDFAGVACWAGHGYGERLTIMESSQETTSHTYILTWRRRSVETLKKELWYAAWTLHWFKPNKINVLLQIDAQETLVTGMKCESGLLHLQFTEPSGPSFRYNPPTASSFGDQPLVGKHVFQAQTRIA